MKRLDALLACMAAIESRFWNGVIWLARRFGRMAERFAEDIDYWVLVTLFAVVIYLLWHIHADINEIGVELGLDW